MNAFLQSEADGSRADVPAAAGRGKRLRIAFFVNQFPVISETFVINLARAVIEGGDHLDIYPVWGLGHAADAQPDVAAYRLMDHVPRPVVCQSAAGRLLGAPAALARALRRHGLKTARLLPPVNLAPRARSGRLLHEAAQLRSEPYDVIHCQFASLAPRALEHLRAGTLAGKLVVHIRGYDITQEVQRIGIAPYREIFEKADRFIANSRHFAETAIRLGCPAEKITVIPSGIDTDRFAFRPSSPPEDRPFRLITVGRLVDKKGIDVAIDALAELHQAGVAGTLEVIGSGPLDGALKDHALRRGMDAHVRFLGPQTAGVVKERLLESDLFIASSRTAESGDQDAGTNTVKEAMAVGLPVVASRHGGLPELIVEGGSGYLCTENSAASLAEAICRSLDDRARWAEIARQARARVVGYASNETVARQVYDVYRAVQAEVPCSPR